ncbi:MAG: PAS domain S-box protein [Alphaproteobacteria bacterium]|nr:PAS domain S-box protein [Alphaproteobacteria bacterium]
MVPKSSSQWVWCGVLALACMTASAASASLTLTLGIPPPAWVPAGLAFGALAAWGLALWPGALLGWLLGALAAGLAPPDALIAAAAGTAGAAAGAAVFRWAGARPQLDRFRDVGILLLGALPLDAAVSAVAGSAGFAATGLAARGLVPLLLGGLVCAAFSLMAFTPLALGLRTSRWPRWTVRQWWELAAVFAVKTVSAAALVLPLPQAVHLAILILNFPILAWMAMRFNLLALGALLALTLGWGLVGTAMGYGPLVVVGYPALWFPLTGFAVLASSTSLLLYAATEVARRMRRDLTVSERRLRDIADSASDFFWETDESGRLLYVSERFAEFVGSETEVLLGRLGFEDTLAELRAGDWPEVTEAIRQRRGYRNLRVPVTVMSGDQRVLQVSGKPVFDDAGVFRGYRGACSDVTEQLEAADALFQAQKMETVGQLTGGLAHDFNNLLAVIIGNLELAEEYLDGMAEAAGMVRKAIDASERGALLIQRLLAFSRRQALSPRVVDVNALVSGFADIIRQAAGDGVAVKRTLHSGLWLVRVDPTQLESAILNLALNGRDAMKQGGTLTIETRNQAVGEGDGAVGDGLVPGDYVTVSVSDTGCGMDEETLSRVFEPFFTTKETGRGSGLGLSMVYGFARQSGGAVDARSTPGEGTTMTVYLPRHAEADGAGTGIGGGDAVPHGRGERILLVEDDPGVRDLMARRLLQLGYQVSVAEDGAKALALLGREPGIALLLSDIVLPGGLYGDNVAQEARKLRPDLKVLFMSGYPKTARDRIGGEEMPVLRKPFRNQDLARQLRRLLDRVDA